MSTSLIEVEDLQNVDRLARLEIARKVGRIIRREQSDGSSSVPTDRDTAIELARLLADDTSIAVREALSMELRSCSFLPSDLIQTIVSDIDQIAMPFLVSTDALDETALEDMVYNFSDAVQEAIAKRENLSEKVSYAICDTAGRDAVENLVENDSAELSERSQKRVIERFPEERPLLTILSQRSDLSINVVEKLIFKISRQYSEYLMQRFNLEENFSSYLTALANQTVFISTLNLSPISEIVNYLEQLYAVKQLSADRLLTYLQKGNLRVFVCALSIISDRKYEVVEKALSIGGKKALNKLLMDASVPPRVAGAMNVAFERQYNR